MKKRLLAALLCALMALASLASLAATSAIPIITTTGHTSPHEESTASAPVRKTRTE